MIKPLKLRAFVDFAGTRLKAKLDGSVPLREKA
jgi:hypothetical protein